MDVYKVFDFVCTSILHFYSMVRVQLLSFSFRSIEQLFTVFGTSRMGMRSTLDLLSPPPIWSARLT